MGLNSLVDEEELNLLRSLAREAAHLRGSDNVMTARAAERISIILKDLLSEIAPFDFLGPWQPID